MMFAYIDKQGGISVLVDIFGVAIYDIKVCRHIPKFCENNYILQKLILMVLEIENMNVCAYMIIMMLYRICLRRWMKMRSFQYPQLGIFNVT